MSKQVYFAERNGKIKIGVASSVADRLVGLRTGSAEPLELIAAVPGNLTLERALHKKLQQHRVNGEWFKDCAEVRAAIQNSVNNFGETNAPTRKTWSRTKFGAVAKLLWPDKTAVHLAAIAGRDPRTAERWLSGEFEPPLAVVLALIAKMFARD